MVYLYKSTEKKHQGILVIEVLPVLSSSSRVKIQSIDQSISHAILVALSIENTAGPFQTWGDPSNALMSLMYGRDAF